MKQSITVDKNAAYPQAIDDTQTEERTAKASEILVEKVFE